MHSVGEKLKKRCNIASLKKGSKLIHDDEHSHQILVKELELTEEFCKSAYQEYLTKADNPLTPINTFIYKKVYEEP